MRVLQLISSAGNYGAENSMVVLSHALQREGLYVHVGVFSNQHAPNREVADRALQAGLPVELIDCRGRVDFAAIRNLRKFIQTQKIDVVHTHGYKANLYGYRAAAPVGIPVLATCHNWADSNVPLWIYSALDRLALRRFTHVAAVSEGVKASLRRFGVPERKISVISNGIDIDALASARPSLREGALRDRRIVGMVGRLVWAKGPEYLLRVAREILDEIPETIFVFVGDGPARKDLETMARQLGIEEATLFLGQRDDMPSVYASLDVSVLPSLMEGMPMTILEALAAARAVVATRVGAIPQLIRSEETGLLVDPGNTEQLRDALLRLLRDGDLRQRLGERGRKLAEKHYSAKAMAQNYIKLYETALIKRAD